MALGWTGGMNMKTRNGFDLMGRAEHKTAVMSHVNRWQTELPHGSQPASHPPCGQYHLHSKAWMSCLVPKSSESYFPVLAIDLDVCVGKLKLGDPNTNKCLC
jgi:hypothetical protein